MYRLKQGVFPWLVFVNKEKEKTTFKIDGHCSNVFILYFKRIFTHCLSALGRLCLCELEVYSGIIKHQINARMKARSLFTSLHEILAIHPLTQINFTQT